MHIQHKVVCAHSAHGGVCTRMCAHSAQGGVCELLTLVALLLFPCPDPKKNAITMHSAQGVCELLMLVALLVGLIGSSAGRGLITCWYP